MTKRRWKKKGQDAPNVQTEADPTTRSISLFGDLCAVASGKRWRVVNTRSGDVLQSSTAHDAPVRGLAFSPDGQYLVTCADDKTACMWRTSDWTCLHRLKSGKKATSCTFSADSQHIFFSDRFGDVLTATVLPAAAPAGDAATAAAEADGSAQLPAAVEANLLLGHLQSIVTSLACCSSTTGQPLLVSTDKDGKVRASVLPVDPLKGSYEIHSYCLGHTKFVTSATAVPTQTAAAAAAGDGSNTQQQQQHLVVSGSGDGTIRLWDVDTGKQVSSYVASEQPPPLAFQKQQEEAGGAPEGEQEQEQGGQEGQDEDAAAASGSENEEDQQQQQDKDGPQQEDQQQQQQQQQGGSKAAAAGQEGADSAQKEGKAAGSKGFVAQQGGRYHKARETCCAVVCVAASPDGATIAAAVEGQQELQLLSLDRSTGQMQLQQKLAFPDVANPAAVAFDSTGRLWAVGGVLVRETESAHVGVAAKAEGSGQWEVVTSAVLPDAVRAALELRVQGEEDKQQQQQQQESYYFDSFKKAVYVLEEGGEPQKRPRRDARDIERLRALAAAKDKQQQQEEEQQQASKGNADAAQD